MHPDPVRQNSSPSPSRSPSCAPPAPLARKANRYLRHGSPWILGPLLIGLLAVALALGAEKAAALNQRLYTALPLAPLLALPAWFALGAFLARRYFPGTQGSGIPQAIAALEIPPSESTSRLLSLRIVVGKIFLTIGGLLFGASIGREGPTVQIGASVMQAFHARSPVRSAAFRRKLIVAGGAAGIAAAFNTPLAGLMFAVEEMSKKHVFNANASVLMTVVLSGLIPVFLMGNYAYFGSTGATLAWQVAVPVVVVCGIAGGLGGGIFSRLLQTGTRLLPRAGREFAQHRPFLFAALCGLAVAIIGVSTHGLVFGTGYEPTRLTLEDREILPWYFGIAKLLATLLSSMSGIAGGFFAPTLAIGAGFGDDIALLFPSIAPHGALIVLGMAAYLAGVTRAPITAFVIMMEMTDSHALLLPLMASALIANGVSRFISPPLYDTLAERWKG